MSDTDFFSRIDAALEAIEAEGLTKIERIMTTPQSSEVGVSTPEGEKRVINLCSNNYLGLANDSRIIAAARSAMEEWGAGLASVRFICGTQTLHKKLEHDISAWLGYEDTLLFAACFDANGAVFEPLLGAEDAIISDSLNHASIIDGIRLSKARRYVYRNGDMSELASALTRAREDGARTCLVVTDGVFSMDGAIPDLISLTDIARAHGALVMVDDCHATGLIGPEGRGSGAYRGVADRIDILTGTLGKALGGGMGGFVCARAPVIRLLRQRARPYLFSNTLAPAIAGAAIEAVRIARTEDERRSRVHANARRLRSGLTEAGFTLLPGEHPIIPVMIGDAAATLALSASLFRLGVYATGFSFPVVPRGAARVRLQASAAHDEVQIDLAIAAFRAAGQETGIL
jgi:glycine C-acetyltransferase